MTLAALAATSLLAACGGGGDASAPLDTVAPSLAISDNVSAATATGPVTFTFTFSEAVADFDASDIVVAGGTPGAFAISGTGRIATLVVTPSANTTGTIQVSVAAPRYTDVSGNANTTSATASQAFDTTGGTPPPPPPPPPPGNNLVANGDFSGGGTGWSGNALNVITEGGNSFNLANVAIAGDAFNVNLSYVLPIPTQGVRYRLTFSASSNRNRTMIAGIGLNEGPFTNTSETVNLTTTAQNFVLELTANFASNNSRVLFDMGADTGTVVIDDVVLEVIQDPAPAVLIANGDFSAGATGWSGNALNVITEGGNSFNLANVATAGEPFNVNLSYGLSIPTQGVRYRLTFNASSNRNRTMVVGIGLAGAPFTAATETVNLTTTSQTFVRELTANFASNSSRVIFDMGADTGTVVIDDVVLEIIPSVALPAPSTAAPAPTARAANDVRSIFSDSFTNIASVDFNPDFGPNARIEDAVIAGNNTKYMDVLAGELFVGISFTSSKFDASSFTHFAVDYWVADPVPAGQILDIKLSNHDGVDQETSAVQFTVAPITGGSWQRLNIPLANFQAASAPANLSRNAIAQIVITAARADTGQPVRVYFDNMHFYR